MLLLVVDDANAFPKKEIYAQRLDVDGVMHVNTLTEAEEIIGDKNQIDLLLINNILIENIQYELDELKRLNSNFSGGIILKVDDELLGMKLLKSGTITEYYLSNEDKIIELCNLQKAFRLASIKTKISKGFCDVSLNLEKINKLELCKMR